MQRLIGTWLIDRHVIDWLIITRNDTMWQDKVHVRLIFMVQTNIIIALLYCHEQVENALLEDDQTGVK